MYYQEGSQMVLGRYEVRRMYAVPALSLTDNDGVSEIVCQELVDLLIFEETSCMVLSEEPTSSPTTLVLSSLSA